MYIMNLYQHRFIWKKKKKGNRNDIYILDLYLFVQYLVYKNNIF